MRKFFIITTILLSVTLIASINLVLFTHLPVTAERSVSVFLLGQILKDILVEGLRMSPNY